MSSRPASGSAQTSIPDTRDVPRSGRSSPTAMDSKVDFARPVRPDKPA